MLILDGRQVRDILDGRDLEVVERVMAAYRSHARGLSSLPHSSFLRFPGHAADRMIALPAYVKADRELAGIKWVSSFPDNIQAGLDRASAVVILNSLDTGYPLAVLEGSTISARRTAASAALAARVLQPDQSLTSAGLVGCGLINFEVARFLVATRPALRRLVVFDIAVERARRFQQHCRARLPDVDVEVAQELREVIASQWLISFATTATRPYVDDLSGCRPGALVLHISLRDIEPAAILACDNVADDVDHVCRAQTSLHLAEQAVGHRRFVRCTLGDILVGNAAVRTDPDRLVVFSPFGLGLLDIAVADLVYDIALRQGTGLTVDEFLPDPWGGTVSIDTDGKQEGDSGRC